jgi:WD40 repeat protein/DNA-binding SARP family transcriptional activator
MQIRVLGHLEATADDRPVSLGGAKQRAVLAMLGLEANHTVTADRLIEGLWGEEPPRSAAKMVQTYVWRLRAALANGGGAEILTHGRGYELRIDRDCVDVCRLERLVSDAARAAAAGEPGGAAREALALFRGSPLADLADEPFANAEIRRLEELRQTAAELAIEADLAAGGHQEVVAEIEALLAEHPLRERLHAQRMLALYRCGRQAEALAAYRDARRTLIDEIGVEPAPELRRLHDAILRQDPSLDVQPRVRELPRELDAAAAPPLIGRAGELRRARAQWQRAAAGGGALVTIVGAYGMGKTRMAAELAADAHRDEATVLYAAGTGPPEAALAAIARARDARRPMLLVLDDADRAPAEVRLALGGLAVNLGALPVLVLATGQEAAALARLGPHDSITLDPLDADAVGMIAGFYAPTAGGATIPVEELLAASRGVARRVHEAASEWARREATRRVDGMADRAAARRREASALEAELAGSVVELQSARERAGLIAGDGVAADGPVVCPYKGLAPFDAEDAESFFGRERLVAELVARLVGASLLAVVGPSGSGKSSVLRAGLLPALAGGVLPGSDQWAQAVMRPGERPLRELRRTTRRLAREWRSILVIDQFEELFTLCPDEEERAEFVAALVRAAEDRNDSGVVVLGVRADFYGRCAAYPELSRLLGASQLLVGPMSREELQRAIERPAQRAGLTVEPELVDALLADVEGRPGALPLLSTTLLELWRERDGRRLRLAAYVRSGGVQGAVARLAEDAYVRLDPVHQAAARTLLLRLTDEDESGVIVRRRLALDELRDDRSPALAEVAARLTDRRLLTLGEGAIEVAHEALLREWPRLRAWLEEDVQGRRLHRRLGSDARVWDADGRDAGALYRGARLASALDWAAEHEHELSAVERAFLEDGRSASGRAQRRLRAVLAGVAALLLVAVIAGAVALDQRGNARAQATAADAQRLGAQALADDALDRGLLLARQGVALHDTLQTRSNLLAVLLKSPAAIGVLQGDGDRLIGLDLSPDGRTLAFVDNDGTLTLTDTGTGRLVAPRQTISGVVTFLDVEAFDGLRFSPDGSLLAVGGDQPVVVDTRTHRVLVRLRNLENQYVYGLGFSADGRAVYALMTNGPDGTTSIQRYDARSGRHLGSERVVRRGAGLVSLVVSRDGRRLVTSRPDGPTVIRDARTLRPLEQLPVGADALALSRDDRTLLLGGRNGSVRFLDLVGGRLHTASGRHDGRVLRAVLSADGRTAITAGEDDRLIVWDVKRAVAGETFPVDFGRTTGLAMSPDDRTLYSAALDGKVHIWDLTGAHRLGRPFEIGAKDERAPVRFPPHVVPSSSVSPDGRVLAVGQRDGTVRLLDARTLRLRSSFHAVPRGPVRSLAYVPRGRLLMVAGDHGFLALVDPSRGTLVKQLRGQRGTLLATSFSADGRLLVSTSAAPANPVVVWALPSGRRVGRPALEPAAYTDVGDVALSPDGRTLAVAHPSLGVETVDVATGRHRSWLPQAKTILFSVRFTPDGRFLVGGSFKGWARIWSTRTWRPVGRVLAGHTGGVLWQSISPDGRTLATGSTDGTIRLFDLRTRQQIGAPLPGLPNRPVAPQFTPDGAYLFAITDAGRAYRWDVRPSSWARHACAVAGRTLTRAEWNEVLPERDYAPACTG